MVYADGATVAAGQIPVVDGNKFAGLKWTFVRIKYGSYESEGASRLAYWDEPWAIDAPGVNTLATPICVRTLAPKIADKSSVARMPMIATTISSSMSVKPRR